MADVRPGLQEHSEALCHFLNQNFKIDEQS